jgi:hypothetical protein
VSRWITVRCDELEVVQDLDPMAASRMFSSSTSPPPLPPFLPSLRPFSTLRFLTPSLELVADSVRKRRARQREKERERETVCPSCLSSPCASPANCQRTPYIIRSTLARSSSSPPSSLSLFSHHNSSPVTHHPPFHHLDHDKPSTRPSSPPAFHR